MMTEADILAVLQHHRRKVGIRDGRAHCVCGWMGRGLYTLNDRREVQSGADASEHERHLAQALLAAL